MDGIWTDREEQGVRQMLSYAFIGNLETIEPSLQSFADRTAVDEIMVTTHLFDPAKKIRSLELTASIFKKQ